MARSAVVEMPEACSFSAENAWMTIGTFWRFSLLRCAVTTMSPSPASTPSSELEPCAIAATGAAATVVNNAIAVNFLILTPLFRYAPSLKGFGYLSAPAIADRYLVSVTDQYVNYLGVGRWFSLSSKKYRYVIPQSAGFELNSELMRTPS